ncbi:MAG: hydrogenase iron-sulfur subunit [Candidatus Methanofastidiosa archaeon]|nr:hydrogenase iron-sulfur subunit [Candidatus Methanofastidiosa archaeon]
MSDEWEPKIVGFLCNWCCYAGADMAGTSRMHYPANIRVIRVMCSSRINAEMIIKAFQTGADAVFIGGCHPGDCHYVDGNYRTKKRIDLLKRLIEHIGIEPERLRLEWISAAEGEEFAKTMKELRDDIKKLGPSPLREIAREAI